MAPKKMLNKMVKKHTLMSSVIKWSIINQNSESLTLKSQSLITIKNLTMDQTAAEGLLDKGITQMDLLPSKMIIQEFLTSHQVK